jgi:digeranylgeranylglycerophospholipid reductase
MDDVAVVGGGPGGLYTALRLAQRGVRVSVFEEHPTPGDPVHCTGVLAADAFADFELSRQAILNPLRTAAFFGPTGGAIEYTTPGTEALVIDRRVFDGGLADEAQAHGVGLRTGVKVTDIEVAPDGVTLTSADGPVRARAVVLACGASYVLQRRLGLGVPDKHLQSAQVELPALEPGHVEVHFGADVAPRGFAWAVPVRRGERSCARIGLMCDHDAADYFSRFLDRVAPRWQIDVAPGVTPRIKMLPLSPLARTYGTRLLAVGDAAGLVKATTGGGIYYSLVSGRLAADVLADALAAGDLSEEALSIYQQRWKQALGAELEAQLKLREIADHLSDEDVDRLFELARTDGIMPIVRRTAQFNRHRHLIVALLNHPPARRVLMRRMLGWTA